MKRDAIGQQLQQINAILQRRNGEGFMIEAEYFITKFIQQAVPQSILPVIHHSAESTVGTGVGTMYK